MLTIKKASLLTKIISLFSVVRGYNIAVLVLAQYLAAIFIFSPQKSLRAVLLNKQLFYIVIASICVVAAGYIINNFYDVKTDQINRPQKVRIDALVNDKTKLTAYFVFNFLGFIFGMMVSYRAAIFFASYIFLIWFYSHKLKKYPIVQTFSATILAVLPFFAILMYYKNFTNIIFVHGAFVFLLLFIRELVKDLGKIQGNLLQNINTITIKYGESFVKKSATLLSLLALIPVYYLVQYPEIGLMKYYFLATLILEPLFIFFLWKSTTVKHYVLLHNLLKIIIVIGVFSLALIDTEVLIDRIL